MDQLRGVVMIGLGIFLLYRGWEVRTENQAWFAYLLGALAIALGAWRFTRQRPGPLE